MASRIIHIAITKIILENLIVQDVNRLYIGTILPDAYKVDGPPTDVSHYKEDTFNGTKKIYNLTKFRELFLEDMCSDGLFLGYYLHLIQDIIYRKFVYDIYKWNPIIPGNVKKLHNDYRLINTYVINKYDIKNNIEVPIKFHTEKINSIYPFDLKGLLDNMNSDFVPYERGEIFFFTKKMADDYIKMAADFCIGEITALKNKTPFLDEMQYAWRKW